ncbi:MAG: TonB-dependent receptor, partial [Fulvivirga sp.]|nr:TonB-dependent receptor [Fulvivirga sp.]
ASFTHANENIGLNENDFQESIKGMHVKTVFGYDDTERLSLTLGAEHFFRESSFEIAEKGAPDFNYQQHLTATFAESDLYLSNDFVLRTGVRLTYDDLQNKVAFFPRTSFSYRVGEQGQVAMAYGVFSQQARPDYLRVNNNLKTEQAQHFILNYQIITGKRTFRIEGYYKKYENLVKFTDAYDPSTFSNTGAGYAKGIDVFWRDNQSVKGLDYWVSYSWLDTERDYRDFPVPAIPTFASEHNFSVVTKYFWQALKTQIGTTYTFASQRPYNNPNSAGFNTQRTPAYHDLSVNFSYLYRPNVIFHASVTNVLGIDNIFGYEYSDQPDATGNYVGRAIRQPAPRFIFIGAFITLSKNKTTNQLPNL